MFGTIRKHQKWLWLVIITLTIISFVIFFSPYSRVDTGGRQGSYGTIGGDKISEQQFMNARREVELHYFMATGRWPDEDTRRSGFDPMRETYQWLFLIYKQEQMRVHISAAEVAEVARDRIRPFERMGIRSPEVFIKQILQPRGLNVDDFERFCRHSLGIQELINTVGLPGKLVTPQEARSLYEREHQELATAAVFFSASNRLASVTVLPDAVTQFYSNRLANYRIPERMQVSYVLFGLSNYLAQAEADLVKTNLTEIIDANYQRLGSNYFADAKSPEEAKAKIREQLIRSQALTMARKKASDFAGPLFDIEPMKAENLEKQAKAAGLTVKVSAPFDREDGPKDMEVGADFTKAAFRLSAEEPFATPVVGQDGVYVVAFNKRIPSEIPPLDQIREKVVADYRFSQAVTLARQAGLAFAQSLTNGLAQDKSFTNICAEAKVSPVELPPFSISTRSLPEVEDKVSLNQLKQIAFTTPPGKSSSMEPTSDGGLVLFVKQRLPLDNARVESELPAFQSYVRKTRQEEAFNVWFRKEAERGLRDTPLARPQQPPPSMGTGGQGAGNPKS